MRKLIKVTENHIKNGRRSLARHNNQNHEFGDPRSCPVALALKEVNVPFWSVGWKGIMAINGSKNYKTPRSVARFIKRFDFKKPVKPFSFYLDV